MTIDMVVKFRSISKPELIHHDNKMTVNDHRKVIALSNSKSIGQKLTAVMTISIYRRIYTRQQYKQGSLILYMYNWFRETSMSSQELTDMEGLVI